MQYKSSYAEEERLKTASLRVERETQSGYGTLVTDEFPNTGNNRYYNI